MYLFLKDQDKISKANPTLIGRVDGIKFYEHPFDGDESPLIIQDRAGWMSTPFWELPTEEEVEEALLLKEE